MEKPKLDTCIHGHLFYHKVYIVKQLSKGCFFNDLGSINFVYIWKKIKYNPYLKSFTKINFILKCKTTNILKSI